MPDIHLKYGGSTARRTLNCAAWVNLPRPDFERESAAAARGTALHNICETRMLVLGLGLGMADQAKETLSPDDAEAVDTALTALNQLMDETGCEEYVCEAMLTLREDIGGSADVLIWSDTQVYIVDYKFGYQPVTNRDQFLLYAICGQRTPEYADIFEGKKVYSAIIQPAVSPTAMLVEHSAAELERFHDDFMLAVSLAETGTTEGNPGEWCKYCPSAPYCPAKRKQVAEFTQYDPKHSTELANAMALIDQMKEQIKAIEAEAFRALEHGMPVPGWKLVQKQSRRQWIDEQAALRKLRYDKRAKRDDYLVESLRSPAQVEKALKKSGVDISDLVTSRSSGTTLAPADDPRAAVQPVGDIPPEVRQLFADAIG